VALYNGGLRRSVNSGSTFTSINGVTSCSAVGLGKAAPGASYFTLYIWGTVNGVVGVHRSIDEGATWVRVNDDAHEYGGPGNGQFVMGDMNVYGRVYLSTVGRGIAYGEPGGTVPLTWISFSGLLTNRNETELHWRTATEVNNDHFDIERSLDGSTFIKLGSVASKSINSSSTFALDYAYTDDVNGMKGVIYYRLKQVDKDGTYTYSSVISVRKKDKNIETIQVFPNPVNGDHINLKIGLNTTQSVQVRIIGISGSVMHKGVPVKLFAGTNWLKINDAVSLPKGTYIIELINAVSNLAIGRDKIIIQ
jgi:hypothetical protein